MPNLVISQKKEGFFTLMSMLILSVISVSISITLLTSGIISTKNNLSLIDGVRAESYTKTCTENAIATLKEDVTFVGQISLTMPKGSCSANVAVNPSNQTEIQSTGTSGNATKRQQTTLTQINPQLIVENTIFVRNF